MDAEKIRQGVRLLLEGIGEDPEREGLRDTPDRVARMYAELFAGLQGEEESFEDYAPKAVRIPGARYEQMSLF